LQDPWLQVLSAAATIGIATFALSRLRGWTTSPVLQDEEGSFRAAAENSLDDIYLFDGIPDASGRIVDFRFAYINPAAERRLRSPRETLLGRSLSAVRPFAVSSGLIQRYQDIVQTGVPLTEEVFVDDERIHATWLHVHAVKLGNGLAITSRDCTERKRDIDHARFLANHDHLTGLANRSLLLARLDTAIEQAQQQEDPEQHVIAIFLIDVDNFKQINDSLGHAVGDTLLTIVAKRMLSAVRETDTVARIGGDEFVIVMPNFKDRVHIRRCGEKILRNVDKALTIDGKRIHITISAGYSTYPDSGITAAQLLKNADAAMYSVKASGRNGLQSFEAPRSDSQQQTVA
jgi:diguanylate cyclase (GGDEF)-like protein